MDFENIPDSSKTNNIAEIDAILRELDNLHIWTEDNKLKTPIFLFKADSFFLSYSHEARTAFLKLLNKVHNNNSNNPIKSIPLLSTQHAISMIEIKGQISEARTYQLKLFG